MSGVLVHGKPQATNGIKLREGGVEPPRRLRHRILNPARLPISPLSRFSLTVNFETRQFEISIAPVCQIDTNSVRREWCHVHSLFSTPGLCCSSGFARTGLASTFRPKCRRMSHAVNATSSIFGTNGNWKVMRNRNKAERCKAAP